MTTGHVFIATSLDGYIARSDGNLDWLMGFSAAGEDHGYEAFMATMDGLIMGRGTYEKVLTFGAWPYPKPVVIVSKSLTENDLRDDLVGKVEVHGGPPAEVMQRVAKKGWSRAYVDGGKLIQSFLAAGLISDMVISRIPVLLGSGLPLFGALKQDLPLKHLETKAFESGLVQSRYAVAPAGD